MREILSLIANLEREMEAKGAVTAAEAGSVLILFVAMVAGFWMILGTVAVMHLATVVAGLAIVSMLGGYIFGALAHR